MERRSGPVNRLAVELDDASVLEYVVPNVVLVELYNRLVLFTVVWLVAISPIVPKKLIGAQLVLEARIEITQLLVSHDGDSDRLCMHAV